LIAKVLSVNREFNLFPMNTGRKSVKTPFFNIKQNLICRFCRMKPVKLLMKRYHDQKLGPF